MLKSVWRVAFEIVVNNSLHATSGNDHNADVGNNRFSPKSFDGQQIAFNSSR